MNRLPDINKEEIVDFFLTQNHSRAESAAHFNISESTFRYYLKKYNIQKSKKSAAENAKKTFHAHYGVDSFFQTDECKQKCKDAALAQFGVDWPTKAQEVKDKARRTCLDKYGVAAYVLTQEFVEQTKQTCLEKYGVEYSTQSPEVNQKRRQSNLKKYGVPNINQIHIEHLDIWNSRDAFFAYLNGLERRPTILELAEYFNVGDTGVQKRIHQYGVEDLVLLKPHMSKYENEIANLLQSWGITNIERNSRNILDGLEIDIYVPEYKLGIEFNGDYWHSDIFNTDHNGRSLVHQKKSLLAESKGIFLFHIFEYEWNNPNTQKNIINRLQQVLGLCQRKIGARKCTIRELTKQQKADFLTINHIQGNDHSTYQYGLFYKDELVACMTFVRPKSNKYTWELSRFCTVHGTTVQGGASKLFQHFLKMLKPGDTVSSYNDITKTKGDLYKTLGFKNTSLNSPNYVWVKFGTAEIRTRYQEQAAHEVERMHAQGYHRICDAGTRTWVYTKT